MSEEAIAALLEEETEEAEGDEAPSAEEHAKANKRLQAHVKNVEKENATLRGQLIKVHLEAIGLDNEKGLGKAIAKDFKGDMTAEAVATFAREEYGHESAEAPPAAPEVVASQNIEALNNQGTSIEPKPQETEADKAAQRMHDPAATRQEAQASLTHKVDQFAQQHYGPSGPQAPPSQ